MTRATAALFVLLASALPSAAQDWPSKSVRFIVPFGAGATPDIVARLTTDYMQNKLGQNFIVENKPGASGNTGTDAVAKADPDGYTIGNSIGGPLAINAILFGKLPYDPVKDIALVTTLATQASVLAINSSLNVNNVQELVALLKANPGKYNFGSIGNGSLSHLAMEAIALKSGTKMVHIPYPGSPAAVTALLRNDVQMVCLPAISVTSQIASGQIKILAVSTAQRSSYLPDVPTLKEQGIDVEADAWNGVIAPGGTPPAVVEKIRAAVAEAITSPGVKEKLVPQMMDAIPSTPAQFRARIDADIARWTPVIQAANIKVN